MSPILIFFALILLIYSTIKLTKYAINHYQLYKNLEHFPGPKIRNPFFGHLGLFLRIVFNNSLDQYGIGKFIEFNLLFLKVFLKFRIK